MIAMIKMIGTVEEFIQWHAVNIKYFAIDEVKRMQPMYGEKEEKIWEFNLIIKTK